MLYFDTSFLVPLILDEATSDPIEAFMSALPVGELATGHWTRVEFSSLLAREVRMGGLSDIAARKADGTFESVLAESFLLLLPTARDFDRARTFLGTGEAGLRAGDALHLAIAAGHAADAIYSLDKTLLRAGKLFDLPVGTGIALPGH